MTFSKRVFNRQFAFIFMIIVLLFLIIHPFKSIFGQDTTVTKRKIFFSIQSGLFLSKFISGYQKVKESHVGFSYDYDITYHKGFDPGFLGGIYFSYSISKKLSIEAEIDYTTLKKRITYTYYSSSASPGYNDIEVDYIVAASTIYIPTGLKMDMKYFDISSGVYFNNPFNERVLSGYYKSEGFSFGDYPKNKRTWDTTIYNGNIDGKMRTESGLYFSASRNIAFNKIYLALKAGYGIGFIRMIEFPNHLNNFVILTLGVSRRKI